MFSADDQSAGPVDAGDAVAAAGDGHERRRRERLLFGRANELEELDELLDTMRSGRGGALALVGPPGVGKTALLRTLVRRAHGLLVLSVQGVETEADVALAGLHQLVHPVFELVDELPAPQAACLRTALLLAEGAPVDTFALGVSTVGLLGLAARRQPVLVIVDDAHWLDTATVSTLVFAARRVCDHDAVGMVAAVRDDAILPFTSSPFRVVTVRDLDAEAAHELLAAVTPPGSRVAHSVSSQLHDASGGNALVLVEVARTLNADQLGGRAPLPEPLLPSGTSARLFAQDVAELPPGERLAAVVLAASHSGTTEVVVAAMKLLGVEVDALEALEDRRLVELTTGRLVFRHPLLRAAAYAAATSHERRTVHGALAEVTRGSRVEDAAWHAATAAFSADEATAAALESAATAYTRRSGHVAAAKALERAAELSEDGEQRARRLEAAAEAARRAARFQWADRLFDDAQRASADPELVRRVRMRRALVDEWSGNLRRAYTQFRAEAEAGSDGDVERVATACAYAAGAAIALGEVDDALGLARRGAELAPWSFGADLTATRRLVWETLAQAQLECGDPVAGAAVAVAIADRLVEEERAAESSYIVSVLVYLEEFERARALVEPLVAAQRAAGDLRGLSSSLDDLGRLELRCGRWTRARVAAEESVQLCVDTDQGLQLAYSLASLAVVDAGQGRSACEEHAERAKEIGDRFELEVVDELARSALGLWSLGAGRHEQAVAWLAPLAAWDAWRRRPEPGIGTWPPDLVEACVRRGDVDTARDVFVTFERSAAGTARPWALAASARCRSLLAGDEDFATALETGLAVAASSPMPFERARLELELGYRLRRVRQRTEARRHLHAACEIFDDLGAVPWLAAARHELAVAGERVAATGADARASLTPQELQVAVVVAEGATNREAAERMFLSQKTIESHLRSAFRKLDVRSRTELAARLGSARLTRA